MAEEHGMHDYSSRQTVDNNSARDHAQVQYGHQYGNRLAVEQHNYGDTLVLAQPFYDGARPKNEVVEQRAAAMKALAFEEMDTRHATITAAHAETCQWMLANPEYQAWRDASRFNEHQGFLWIKGNAGTGKSTIMKFAFEDARDNWSTPQARTTIVSFFFNAQGHPLERSIEGMYRSLVWQLLSQNSHLQNLLLSPERSKLASGSRSLPLAMLEKLFADVVLSAGGDCFCCFIDALDEGSKDEVRSMISSFGRLGELALRRQVKLFVCFSSRHWPHISYRNAREIILENEPKHHQDINIYIKDRLRIGRSLLANGITEEEYDHGNIIQLRDRLGEIPDGLANLFQDIVKKGNDTRANQITVLTLQWILFSRQALKCEELYYAIISGHAPAALGEWNQEELTWSDMSKYILHCSRGLAELTPGPYPVVRFIHESVRDYLLLGHGMRTLEPQLGLNPLGMTHNDLSLGCRNYITVVSHADTPSAADVMFEKYPFLAYSLRWVLYHANLAAQHGLSQNEFVHNFSSMHWLRLTALLDDYAQGATQQAKLLEVYEHKHANQHEQRKLAWTWSQHARASHITAQTRSGTFDYRKPYSVQHEHLARTAMYYSSDQPAGLGTADRNFGLSKTYVFARENATNLLDIVLDTDPQFHLEPAEYRKALGQPLHAAIYSQSSFYSVKA